MYSSGRFVPGNTAAKLCEFVRRMALRTDALALLFSGSARKPRVLARFTASANVVPFAANNF